MTKINFSRIFKARLSFKGKMAAVAAFGALALSLQGLARFSETHAFMINASESLPNWAFYVKTGSFPKRGEYVIFRPGEDSLVTQYFGSHPSPFAKIAYGMPGDVVERRGNDVFVNGQPVATLKPYTRHGIPLTAGPTGIIPNGCIYAGSGHKDGFDSRYANIGFVCRDRLIGVGKAVL